MALALAILIGGVAGLRTMMAPAAVSWAAYAGGLDLGTSWLAFMGAALTPYVLSVFAAGELVTDQLPNTPSRTIPVQFGARLLSGALSGAGLAAPSGLAPLGALGGGVGAVVGTLGGAALRARLAARFGADRPAALIEDAIAVLGALVIVRLAA
ncbi:MAG: DUF4126 domain-containing protein [Deltaproteobacteria bacterium]|nr:DUF4126 domain-containing protein [Deltaproteobacteria bacterium]